MQETKINRKSNCTNCNIPGCKQTPFCKYCRSVKDISGARRSLYLHVAIFIIIIIVLTIISVL